MFLKRASDAELWCFLLSTPEQTFTQPFIQVLIKDNIKVPCHWPLCAGNSPVTGEFPAEKISIWWRHRGPDFNDAGPLLLHGADPPQLQLFSSLRHCNGMGGTAVTVVLLALATSILTGEIWWILIWDCEITLCVTLQWIRIYVFINDELVS